MAKAKANTIKFSLEAPRYMTGAYITSVNPTTEP